MDNAKNTYADNDLIIKVSDVRLALEGLRSLLSRFYDDMECSIDIPEDPAEQVKLCMSTFSLIIPTLENSAEKLNRIEQEIDTFSLEAGCEIKELKRSASAAGSKRPNMIPVDKVKRFARLFSLAINGIDEHFENDEPDKEHVIGSLITLIEALYGIIDEADQEGTAADLTEGKEC